MKPLGTLTAAAVLAVAGLGEAGRAAEPGLQTPATATPERLLPATAQVYFRWDGITAHREQYARTALGQLVAKDLAPLRKELLDLYPRLLRSELTERKLLDGTSPQRLAKIHAAVAESSKLLDVLAEHGVVVAAEFSPLPSVANLIAGGLQAALGGKKPAGNPLVPRILVTIVVPDAAADARTIMSTMRLLDSDKSFDVKEESIAGRNLLHAAGEGFHVTTWVEGHHVVVAIGTEPPPMVLAAFDSKAPRLDSHPLYQRLQVDDGFRTDLRGFVDAKALVGMAQKLAAVFDAAAARKIEALGLDGMHAVVYRGGFDGARSREVIEVDAPGPRKGVLKLTGGRPIALDEMPPLPPDVSRWSAHRLDPAAAYEVALQLYDLTHPPDPEDKTPETAAQRLDKAAGLDVKADLLPYLGDTVVAYSSPSEGLIAFGQVFAVQVKDGERVLQALDQIVQTQAGGAVRLRKRPIGDGEVREVYVRKQGFFFTPTYAVHKGWLVASLFPQPVQAFVQRTGGARAWEPDESVKAGLAALPKTATGLAVADVRPSVQQGLTFAPLLISAMQSFGGGGNGFEVGTLPSGSVVNQRLTPTVTTLTDDGTRLRWESRGAVVLPGDFLGVDPIMLLLSASIFN